MEESKESQYKHCLTVKSRDILKGVGVNVTLIMIYLKPFATNNKKKSTSESYDNNVDEYLLHNKTDFVQWIVIVTAKSMHLVFHAKRPLMWNEFFLQQSLSFSHWIPFNSR